MQQVLILANRHAGAEHRFWIAFQKLRNKLNKKNIPFQYFERIEDIPLQLLKKSERLIILGGDGTINFATKYLYANEINIPIGIVPVGSSNIFAYTIGLPINLNKATKVALEGIPKQVHPGIINQKTIFLLATTTGEHAVLMKKTPRWSKRFLGGIAYYLRLPIHLALIKRHHYSLILSDQRKIETFASTIFILNGFKGIPHEPFTNMNIFEPKLYLLVLEITNALEFFHALTSIFIRGKIPKKVLYFETPALIIETSDAPLVIDGGEDILEKKLEITIAPRSFWFLVPK